MKKVTFKSMLLTVLFGAIYTVLSLVIEGVVKFDKVVISMLSYFLVICLLYYIAPKLRKITGHDKDKIDG